MESPRSLPPRAGESPKEQEYQRAEDPHSMVRIRDSDLEPYVGLRYLSRLFKLMALVLVLMLFAEIVTSFSGETAMSASLLIVEISRWVVLAGILWGAGDLAMLMIDVGHDVRATRILLSRQAIHHMVEHHPERRESAGGRPPAADLRSAESDSHSLADPRQEDDTDLRR
jgi:hypothetical protein